ncbi:hypothetical protein ACHAP8_007386 [Fusarium lateritium]
MPQLFVPYDASMRMGMGFNSYTHKLCMRDVGCHDKGKHTVEDLTDTFIYSSSVVERPSDIATALEISQSTTIIDGSLDPTGGGKFINEDKIISADVNLLVSIRIMSRTFISSAPDDFEGADGLRLGSTEFHDAFGDSYISGFVEGGYFIGIISFRCLDGSDRNSIIQAIGDLKQTKTDPSNLNEILSSASERLVDSSALQNAEITISVRCSRGKSLQAIDCPWDIHGVYKAAAAFLNQVASDPQDTWAIINKFDAFRSLTKAPGTKFLDYGPVMRYTATLFDDFMKYKGLVRYVQDVLSNGDQYIPTAKPNSIPLDTATLLAVRTALRNEMDKIVSVVNTLVKTPEILSQVDSFAKTTKNELVRNIIDEALLPSPTFKDILRLNGAEPFRTTSSHSSDASTRDFREIRTPVTSDLNSATNDEIRQEENRQDMSIRSFETKMNSLVAPEVWEALLPIRKSSQATHNQASKELKILAAVCGIHDVTSVLQALVLNGEMTIRIDAIKGVVNDEIYKRGLSLLGWNLSFIYQYGDGAMHICSANYDEKSSESVHVNKTSEHAIVTPRKSMKRRFHLVAIVYGGLIFDSDQLKTVEDHMIHGCKSDLPHDQCIMFKDELIGSNPWPGVEKTGIVFFTNPTDSRIQVAVGLEGRCCLLKDQRQLVELHNDAVQGIETAKKKDDATTQGLQTPISLVSGLKTPRYTCTFDFVDLKVQSHYNFDPLLSFDNGVYFKLCSTDTGFNIRVHLGQSSPMVNADIFTEWGATIQVGNRQRGETWTLNPKNDCAQLGFSSTKPYIKIFGKEGYSTWHSDLMITNW